VAAPSYAAPDPADITFYSKVSNSFRDGELSGCSATFDVLHRDAEYQHGEYVHVSGSLNYTVINNAPYFTLKLGVRPNPDTNQSFVAPAEAFLIQGGATNKANAIAAINGEMPGFRMFPFHGGDPTATIALTFVDTGKLSFGYAMEPHGTLSVVEADLKIASVDAEHSGLIERAPDAPGKWLECVSDVTRFAVAKTTKRQQ
jgi:hypothetical protein